MALVAEIGIVAATLDGKITPRKMESLSTAIRLLPGMSSLSDAGLDLLIARAGADSENAPAWLCETTHRIRSATLRRVAFRLACMLCTWDGQLDELEQEYLLALTCRFDFSDAEAAGLFAQSTGWPLEVPG